MDAALFIYERFNELMKSVGRKISKARYSDITKTYQYRAASKFVDKSKEIGLDIEQMAELMSEIVKYAKKNRLLHKGITVLNMADVFEIGCRQMEATLEMTKLAYASIIESHKLIANINNLADQQSLGGYSKLTHLVNNGSLPSEMLAISKKCNEALQKLDDGERAMHPSDIDLLRIRIGILLNRDRYNGLKSVMGNDLMDSGVPS